MGVDIDKAGGDDLAGSIDFFAALAGNISDRRYLAVADRNIAVDQITPAAVGNGSAADYKIIVAHIALPLKL